MVSNLLIGYELKKKGNIYYSSTLFPRVVTVKSDSFYASGEHQNFFLLFYPHYRQTVDQRLDLLVTERYGGAGRIALFFGNDNSIRKTLLQVNCLIDWVSFLSFKDSTKEPQLTTYFDNQYPKTATWFDPIYFRESLGNILPLVNKIWADLSSGEKNYFLLDSKLAKVFSSFDVNKRRQLFARFLIEAKKQHRERMFVEGRFPFDVYWSEDINSVIQSVTQLNT